MASDARCFGIDGCPDGWVAAGADGVQVADSLAAMLEALDIVAGRDIVAIDMPIGLADTGRRACDVAARQALTPIRQNSVFWTATRAAVHAPTHGRPLREAHAEASRINQQNAAGGVSAQAYHLFPKIREVDALLIAEPALRETVVEVHPELAFACWQGEAMGRSTLVPMSYAKKCGLGAHDRLALIFDRYPRAHFEAVRAHHRPSGVADDDIADAYAALYSAERIAAHRHVTLPDAPPTDAHGLPIRICY